MNINLEIILNNSGRLIAMTKLFNVLMSCFLTASMLTLSSCGGGGASSGGSGSSSPGVVVGTLFSATETTGAGQIEAQDLYSNGSVGTASVVATYCSGNIDHGIVADTTVSPGTTYLYSLCHQSSRIVGWSVPTGSAPSTLLTEVVSPMTTATGPIQMTLTPDGKFLFVAGDPGIAVYSVGTNGSLTSYNPGITISNPVWGIAVSPSGKYLILAEASGGSPVMAEYAISYPSGILTQVGSNVSVPDVGVAGLYPAPNTNSGDLLVYSSGSNTSPYVAVITAGSTWGSGNIVQQSLPGGGNASFGSPTLSVSESSLYIGANGVSGICNGQGVLYQYPVGTNGSSIGGSPTYTCGMVGSWGYPVAYDGTDNLLIDLSSFSVGGQTPAYIGVANTGGSYGQVFVK